MAEKGFSFKINPLFLLVVLLFSLVGMIEEVLVAFGLVVLHEVAHCLTAYLTGYNISKIEVFPFGGMAEYRGLLEMEPWDEIVIALAGPVFNFILLGLVFLTRDTINFPAVTLDLLIKYNIIIGVFNLLPALPLDGGRVLRGLLVSKFGFQQGTKKAIKFSKVLAIIGVIIGLIAVIFNESNIWVLFISFFVYGVTIKEEKQVVYSLLSYLTRRKNYIYNMQVKPVSGKVVRGDLFLKEVISYIIPDKYNIFYILDAESRIAGEISESKLLDTFFGLKKRDIEIIDIIENNKHN